MNNDIELVVILGPTAVGKTRLAVALSKKIHGEIISADSRQVYRGLDIGTGKDLEEYGQGHEAIPVHLVDILDVGEKYNVFRFQHDFLKAKEEITANGHVPVLCGGTPMYLDSVIQGYRLIQAPQNPAIRAKLENRSTKELETLMARLRPLSNNTDLTDRQRLIRAIEIAVYSRRRAHLTPVFPKLKSMVFGLKMDRSLLRKTIRKRLARRLDEGMIAEVRGLLARGISPELLYSFGLEYRHVNNFIHAEATRRQMELDLASAIINFAKRQLSFFRRMERKGVTIHWLKTEDGIEANIEIMLRMLNHRQTSG